jgi:hypothetical protein
VSVLSGTGPGRAEFVRDVDRLFGTVETAEDWGAKVAFPLTESAVFTAADAAGVRSPYLSASIFRDERPTYAADTGVAVRTAG